MCRFYDSGIDRYYRLCYAKGPRRGEKIFWPEPRPDIRSGRGHVLLCRLPPTSQLALFGGTELKGLPWEARAERDAENEKRYRALGRKLSYARNKAGLSQRTVALKAGIDNTYLSKIENGMMGASAETIERLADVIGAPVGDLLASAGKLPSGAMTVIPQLPALCDVLFKAGLFDEEKLADLNVQLEKLAAGMGG